MDSSMAEPDGERTNGMNRAHSAWTTTGCACVRSAGARGIPPPLESRDSSCLPSRTFPPADDARRRTARPHRPGARRSPRRPRRPCPLCSDVIRPELGTLSGRCPGGRAGRQSYVPLAIAHASTGAPAPTAPHAIRSLRRQRDPSACRPGPRSRSGRSRAARRWPLSASRRPAHGVGNRVAWRSATPAADSASD